MFIGLHRLARIVPGRLHQAIYPWWHRLGGVETWFTLGTALVVAMVGLIGISSPKPIAESSKPGQDVSHNWLWRVIRLLLNQEAERSARWFGKHMRPLIISGSLVI